MKFPPANWGAAFAPERSGLWQLAQLDWSAARPAAACSTVYGPGGIVTCGTRWSSVEYVISATAEKRKRPGRFMTPARASTPARARWHYRELHRVGQCTSE